MSTALRVRGLFDDSPAISEPSLRQFGRYHLLLIYAAPRRENLTTWHNFQGSDQLWSELIICERQVA